MKKICLIYPMITSYTLPLIQGMAKSCQLDVIYSKTPVNQGFGDHCLSQYANISWIQVETLKPFGNKFGMYQKGIAQYLMRNRPDAVVIFVNPRYISFWSTMVLGRLFGVAVYPRGHGLFKKPTVGILNKIMYKLILGLCKKYICYTSSVAESLKPLTHDENILVVDNNVLYNTNPVPYFEKNGKENGILFIGRLRSGCGIEILIRAVENLRKRGYKDVILHVVGDGKKGIFVRKQAALKPWIFFDGEIYDDAKINAISRECRFGCYPGKAGLSVVHMMSLSLPPMTHDDMVNHQGPEPSYIQSGINGWLYSPRGDTKSLTLAFRDMWDLPEQRIRDMQKAAFDTYQNLSTPPFHERLLKIVV